MSFDSRLPQAHRAAISGEELLALPDEDFIHCAYWTMLGRAADSDGMAHFRSKIRSGTAKGDILLLLSRSKEGQAHDVRLPEIRLLVKRQALARHRWLGFYYRRLYKIAKDDAASRQLNMLENRVMAIAAETNKQIAHVEALLANGRVVSTQQQKKRTPRTLAPDRARSGRAGEILSRLSAAIDHENVDAA